MSHQINERSDQTYLLMFSIMIIELLRDELLDVSDGSVGRALDEFSLDRFHVASRMILKKDDDLFITPMIISGRFFAICITSRRSWCTTGTGGCLGPHWFFWITSTTTCISISSSSTPWTISSFHTTYPCTVSVHTLISISRIRIKIRFRPRYPSLLVEFFLTFHLTCRMGIKVTILIQKHLFRYKSTFLDTHESGKKELSDPSILFLHVRFESLLFPLYPMTFSFNHRV